MPKDLLPTLWRGVRGASEADDPVAPVFYDTRAPDLVLRRTTDEPGGRVGEAQFWELPIRTANGCSVWAATTSVHDRTQWDWTRLYPDRLRDPEVDGQRDALAQSLAAAGNFDDLGRFAFATTDSGSGPGGSYTTDGKVALLRQPGCGAPAG